MHKQKFLFSLTILQATVLHDSDAKPEVKKLDSPTIVMRLSEVSCREKVRVNVQLRMLTLINNKKAISRKRLKLY